MKYNGKKIRELRRKANMSSLKLAEGICSNKMLFQIEENTAIPSEKVVSQIAEKLGVTVAKLQYE